MIGDIIHDHTSAGQNDQIVWLSVEYIVDRPGDNLFGLKMEFDRRLPQLRETIEHTVPMKMDQMFEVWESKVGLPFPHDTDKVVGEYLAMILEQPCLN